MVKFTVVKRDILQFRVGDKVRRIIDNSDSIHVGDIGTIVRIIEDSSNPRYHQIVLKEYDGFFIRCRFELV